MIGTVIAAVLTATNMVYTTEITNSIVYNDYTLGAWTPDIVNVGLGGLYHSAEIEVDGSTISITTNAITTVISMNTVMTDNARPMPVTQTTCAVYGCTKDHIDYGDPATERTMTSTVTTTDTLTIEWDGKPYTVTRDRVLSTKVKRYELTASKWSEKQRTKGGK